MAMATVLNDHFPQANVILACTSVDAKGFTIIAKKQHLATSNWLCSALRYISFAAYS